MYKQYIKQALYQLKENKLLSFITIAGTALAIAMIMAMVMTQRIEVENFAPEVNRNRTLHMKWMSAYQDNDPSNAWHSRMSVFTAKECFKALTTAEAVSIYASPKSFLASGLDEVIEVDVLQSDADFWEVFQFSFIEGKPFDEPDVESRIKKAVISEYVARKLYGTVENVVGRTISLDYSDYTVAAVVKDVSQLASTAYAQVWIPYTTTNIVNESWTKQIMGSVRVVILAHSAKDFPAIREEVERLRLKFNDQLDNQAVRYLEQPDVQAKYIHRAWANETPDMQSIVTEYIVVICLLLLVPAINLSGITLSRMRKRFPELGVRRSFGATRNILIGQILAESLVLTLIGGALGLLLSYGSLYWLNEMLFSNSTNIHLGGTNFITASMLLDPMTFISAFFFCLVLNLLSVGIPAWRASHLNIVNALNS